MSIIIKTNDQSPDKLETGLLVIPVDSSLKINTSLPDEAKKALVKHLKKMEFTGKWGKAELILTIPSMKAVFIAIVGIGDELDQQAEGLRRGLAIALKDARKHSLRKVAIDLTGVSQLTELTKAAVETVHLSNYRFFKYSKRLTKEYKNRSLQEMVVLTEARNVKEVKKTVKRSQNVMLGVDLTRHLVNQPASDMSPRHLVKAAQDINKSSARFTLKIMDKKKAAKEGFSAFLDVAKGSKEEPYVLHLTYKPKKKSHKKIMLVGKGITFDSGGLSLKPAEYMESMKLDMAGAATVMGVMSTLPQLNIDVEVHGIMPICENMPSGSAYRPGDVLTARNGKTIEVINTDAEGRIVLADALSYAVDQKPDAVVDLATLTGACVVALGETYAGLFSNNDKLNESLMVSAANVGEGLTALPLPEEYRPFIQSKIADVRNLSLSRYGGAMAGAMFLEEFVGKAAWAHIDIAGPAFSEREILPYYDYGATGYGVRTLINWLEREV